MRIATMLWLWITAAGMALDACRALPAPDPGPHSLATGAKGGGFHLYGDAVTQALGADAPVRLVVRETAGSNENIQLLQSGAAKIALVNLGPAYEARNGTASFAPGVRHDRLRALAPMYETPFHLIALRSPTSRLTPSRPARTEGRPRRLKPPRSGTSYSLRAIWMTPPLMRSRAPC
jgi:TRAP-type uncharacterized transport system substrate-binding protein